MSRENTLPFPGAQPLLPALADRMGVIGRETVFLA